MKRLDSHMPRLLLVEKSSRNGVAIRKKFKEIGQMVQILPAATLHAARTLLEQGTVDVIVTDLRLADGMGTELVTLAGEPAAAPVVILLAARDAALVVEVMRAGAMDVVFNGPDVIRDLPLTVSRVLRSWHHIAQRRAAEKALEQSETRYRSLFEAMRSAVAVYQPIDEGRDFRITDFNKAAERMNRIGKGMVLGKRVTEAFPGVREFGLLEVFRRVHLTGRAERFPLTTYKDQRLEYWVENYVYRLPGGEVVAVHDDLTNGKIAERALNEDLARLNTTLDERVQERTAQLNHSLETLRRTQKQLVESEKMASLGNLVAGVAHEISTPLGVSFTAASFLQDTLKEYMGAPLPDEAPNPACDQRLTAISNAVEILMKNLNRAAHLVESFKQVAVDRCVTRRRKIHLRSFIDEVLTTLRPKIQETPHRICFACPEETEILVYPGAIAQILTNLVSNSLWHGFEFKPHGTIWIIVLVNHEQKIHIQYRDNGKGMPSDQVQQIFEPFFTTRRGQGGAGLGMHIVYNLVTQTLGGDIFCHGAPDKGIHFSILFPG
ncbi:MAG: response regulator [Magnetococcales bacterium]|nr:response regulator [Magnetococcales bacterium]